MRRRLACRGSTRDFPGLALQVWVCSIWGLGFEGLGFYSLWLGVLGFGFFEV